MTLLKEYLKQTHELRANTRQLFISYIKPYKAVSTSTISRWIKVVLQRAGIDIKHVCERVALVNATCINMTS
jgi:hypothetical protein